MHYTDSFVWRGLTFDRIEEESPMIVYYLHGHWTVWTEKQLEGELDRERPWRAQWKGSLFRAKLLPYAEAETWQRALDLCFSQFQQDVRKHASELDALQGDLGIMLLERNEAIKSLLELVRES